MWKVQKQALWDIWKAFSQQKNIETKWDSRKRTESFVLRRSYRWRKDEDIRRRGIAFHTLDLSVKDAKEQGVSQIALEATSVGRQYMKNMDL